MHSHGDHTPQVAEASYAVALLGNGISGLPLLMAVYIERLYDEKCRVSHGDYSDTNISI
jgi:hypothetical protein